MIDSSFGRGRRARRETSAVRVVVGEQQIVLGREVPIERPQATPRHRRRSARPTCPRRPGPRNRTTAAWRSASRVRSLRAVCAGRTMSVSYSTNVMSILTKLRRRGETAPMVSIVVHLFLGFAASPGSSRPTRGYSPNRPMARCFSPLECVYYARSASHRWCSAITSTSPTSMSTRTGGQPTRCRASTAAAPNSSSDVHHPGRQLGEPGLHDRECHSAADLHHRRRLPAGPTRPWLFFLSSLFTSFAFALAFYFATMERQRRHERTRETINA